MTANRILPRRRPDVKYQPRFFRVDSAILAHHGPQRAVLASLVATAERLGLPCTTPFVAKTFRCSQDTVRRHLSNFCLKSGRSWRMPGWFRFNAKRRFWKLPVHALSRHRLTLFQWAVYAIDYGTKMWLKFAISSRRLWRISRRTVGLATISRARRTYDRARRLVSGLASRFLTRKAAKRNTGRCRMRYVPRTPFRHTVPQRHNSMEKADANRDPDDPVYRKAARARWNTAREHWKKTHKPFHREPLKPLVERAPIPPIQPPQPKPKEQLFPEPPPNPWNSDDEPVFGE